MSSPLGPGDIGELEATQTQQTGELSSWYRVRHYVAGLDTLNVYFCAATVRRAGEGDMEEYEELEIECIEFDAEDVITTSGDKDITTPEMPIGGTS